MSDFGEGRWITGRKQHRCEYCFGPIPRGESHYNYRGMYDGNWQNWRMHRECYEDYCENADPYDYEFMPGDGEMPQRIRELLTPGAA